MTNPGIQVKNLTEMRLKLAVYAAKYYTRTNRPLTAATLSWKHISQFRELINVVENHTEKAKLLKLTSEFTIPKWVEHFEEYLRGVL